MKKNSKSTLIASAISAAFLLAGPSVFAETQYQTSANEGATHVAGQNEPIESTIINAANYGYAKKMMDMDIVNLNDEDIGSIEDFAINNEGNIEYAIVSVGGVMGLGGKQIAVPFDQLKVRQSDDKIVLDASKEQLERAKEFEYEK